MSFKRSLIPKLHIVEKLPRWITSTDVAAYHPATCTIWIATGKNLSVFRTGKLFLHELGHHIIHLMHLGHNVQMAYDDLTDFLSNKLKTGERKI
jgi:hypothetical protein